MKPQKFTASTVRAALAKVREALGEDAVILSNRATAQGVEVVAIAEQEFESIVSAVDGNDLPPAPRVPVTPTDTGTSFAVSRAMRSAMASPAAPAASPTLERRGTAGSVAPTSGQEANIATSISAGKPVEVKAFSFVDFVRGRRTAKPKVTTTATSGEGPQTASPALAAASTGSPVLAATFAAPHPVAAPLLVTPRAVEEVVAVHPAQPSQSAAPVTAATPAAASPLFSEPREPRLAALTATAEGGRILNEIKSLRSLLEERLDMLANGVESGARLVPAMLRKELTAVGFDSGVVRAALDALPVELGVPQAREWIQARLVRALACASTADDLIEIGGVFAATGPTGVGKTTTIAKLAARCAVRYGAGSIGLITTDTYRIGAPDQLRIYGKIIGAPVHTVHDVEWLRRTLESMRDRRLILVDTIGMGQRDARVGENLDMLDACGVRRLVLLAAASQSETLEEVVERYRGRSAVGAVLTKIDESVKLAPAIGVLLRHKLKLRYLSNGQRVPEDLHVPDALNLVRTALRNEARHKADAPDLSRRGAGMAAAG
jgi:flagellar biosynthesis protein FlhF